MNALLILLIILPMLLGSIFRFINIKYPKVRELSSIIINGIEMALIITLLILNFTIGSSTLEINWMMGLGLSFKVDSFRAIYACISIFLWFMTITFSKEYMHHYQNKDRYYFFYLLTLTGVVGVFFSNDLFTTFVFFEIMSLASYPLVIHEEKEAAMKAGETYIAIAIITGMVLLMGLFMVYSMVGTLNFEALHSYVEANGVSNKLFIAGILMLLGFGAKAGMYPLHIWLPKAHPVAPAPASALLSGILTKTGVFGIIVISSNIFFANYNFASILLALAVITMFLGAVLALFSVDLKRTLACSSMSQIGFILVGISFMMLLGEEGSIAADGAMLHMINHSLIKLVLFMCAGVVAMNLHTLDLNKAKGFGRNKNFLKVIFLIGTVGIMGLPLSNGYASKTLIHDAIVEYIELEELTGGLLFGFKSVEWIFLISGGLTIAYMTKLFICLFVEKNQDPELQAKYDNMTSYLSPLSRVVFVISAIALPIIGILPNIVGVGVTNTAHEFFNLEPLHHHIHFLGWECLKGGLISITIGALIYIVLVRKVFLKNGEYVNLWPSRIDLEFILYRPVIFYLVQGGLYICKYLAQLLDFIVVVLRRTILKPHVYHYSDKSLALKISSIIERRSDNKKLHNYAVKTESFFNVLFDSMYYEISNFTFAFSMVCIGMLIVLIIALIL